MSKIINHLIVEMVANDLIGTCATLNEALEANDYHGDLTLEEHEYLDELAMECECCNWWSEPSEINEGKCEECRDHTILED